MEEEGKTENLTLELLETLTLVWLLDGLATVLNSLCMLCSSLQVKYVDRLACVGMEYQLYALHVWDSFDSASGVDSVRYVDYA